MYSLCDICYIGILKFIGSSFNEASAIAKETPFSELPAQTELIAPIVNSATKVQLKTGKLRLHPGGVTPWYC